MPCRPWNAVLCCVVLGAIAAQPAAGDDESELPAVLAEVKVTNFEAIPLGAGSKWPEIPEFLKDAQVFEKTAAKKDNQLEFEVLKDGLMFIAASWTYDGNASGGWKVNVWTEQKFLDAGWVPVGNMTRLTDNKPDLHIIFRKPVKAGEKLRLHNRKYHAPIVVVPAAKEAKTVAALKRSLTLQERLALEKTPVVTFEDRSATGAALLGLRVSLATDGAGKRQIVGLQPVYVGDKADEPTDGKVLGYLWGNTLEVLARPGYGVGGIAVSSSVQGLGFRLTFVKQTSTGVDKTDTYESRWIGDQLGDTTTAAVLSESRIIGVRAESQPFLRKIALISGE